MEKCPSSCIYNVKNTKYICLNKTNLVINIYLHISIICIKNNVCALYLLVKSRWRPHYEFCWCLHKIHYHTKQIIVWSENTWNVLHSYLINYSHMCDHIINNSHTTNNSAINYNLDLQILHFHSHEVTIGLHICKK